MMGLSLAALGATIDFYLIFSRMIFNQWLSNRPLLIVGTMLIVVGVQLVIFGLLAVMIAFSYRREDDYSIVAKSDERDDILFDATVQPDRTLSEPASEAKAPQIDATSRRSIGR
jgi:hypothetical protein